MRTLSLFLLAASFLITAGTGTAAVTPPDQLKVPAGFKVELLREAGPDEGSWICMTQDDAGRLYIASQNGSFAKDGAWGGIWRVTLADETTKGTKDTKIADGAQPGEIRNPQSAIRNFEKVPLPVSDAMGMLWAFDSLYVSGMGPQGRGIYRCKSSKGDGNLDTATLFKAIPGGAGEHGAHAIILGPDKKLYIVNGNSTGILDGLAPDSPYRHWGEDDLLPRLKDPVATFFDKIKAPYGCVYRTDADGTKWELFAGGFRNPYDIAFNPDGELFTYDADMEWDRGLPWYRPTRILHVVPGGEYGFREGSAKWPAYFPDSLPAVADIGVGCPTGMKFGTDAKGWPEKYRRALFLHDWTYGRILAVTLREKGASYTARNDLASYTYPRDAEANHDVEVFLSGKGMPVTDLEFLRDGSMVFTVGGRGTAAALYRVSFLEKDAPRADDRKAMHDASGRAGFQPAAPGILPGATDVARSPQHDMRAPANPPDASRATERKTTPDGPGRIPGPAGETPALPARDTVAAEDANRSPSAIGNAPEAQRKLAGGAASEASATTGSPTAKASAPDGARERATQNARLSTREQVEAALSHAKKTFGSDPAYKPSFLRAIRAAGADDFAVDRAQLLLHSPDWTRLDYASHVTQEVVGLIEAAANSEPESEEALKKREMLAWRRGMVASIDVPYFDLLNRKWVLGLSGEEPPDTPRAYTWLFSSYLRDVLYRFATIPCPVEPSVAIRRNTSRASPNGEWNKHSDFGDFARVSSLLGIIRSSGPRFQTECLQALEKFPFTEEWMGDDLKLLKLRALELSFARQGRPSEERVKALMEELLAHYPVPPIPANAATPARNPAAGAPVDDPAWRLNRELCALLVWLSNPELGELNADLVEKAKAAPAPAGKHGIHLEARKPGMLAGSGLRDSSVSWLHGFQIQNQEVPDAGKTGQGQRPVHKGERTGNRAFSAVNAVFPGISLGNTAESGSDGVIVRPDNVAVRPDNVSVRSDNLAVRPDNLAVRPDNLAVRPDNVAVRSDDLAVSPDNLAVRPNILAVKSHNGTIHADPDATSPDTDTVRPASGGTRPDDSDGVSARLFAQATPAGGKADTLPSEAPPTTAKPLNSQPPTLNSAPNSGLGPVPNPGADIFPGRKGAAFHAELGRQIIEKTLALMEGAPSQEEQIWYALCLRWAHGWTPEQRVRYFRWFHEKAARYTGGNSFAKFVEAIRADAASRVPESELQKGSPLAEWMHPVATPRPAVLKPRDFVKAWTLPDIEAALDKLKDRKPDLARGKDLYTQAQCAQCHLFRDAGGNVGPDLTAVAQRFGRHDILESITDPSKVIGDQYAMITLTILDGKGGTSELSGLVKEESSATITLLTDPLAGKTANLYKNVIVKREKSAVSIMPPGLLYTLTAEEVADLIGFLGAK